MFRAPKRPFGPPDYEELSNLILKAFYFKLEVYTIIFHLHYLIYSRLRHPCHLYNPNARQAYRQEYDVHVND